MMRYALLLRGVNVGKKNSLPMTSESFENLSDPRAADAHAPSELRTIRDLTRLKHPPPLPNALIRIRPGPSGSRASRRPTEIHQNRGKEVLV